MKIRFTKMHGLGNDFVMIDAISQQVKLSKERIVRLADRRRGIGCDQVLIVESPQSPEADFRYRIFNHDGGEVENCGNGARCFAQFVRMRRLTGKRKITVETCAGLLVLHVDKDENVSVDMGKPILEPEKIPFEVERQSLLYPLEVGSQQLNIAAVSMGNPHAVLVVDNVDKFPVEQLGPLIENHPRFPKRVNAGFMQVINRTTIKLRVFERGAGETLACGTGACAAVVSGIIQGFLDTRVTVELKGGQLAIEWLNTNEPVKMTGPASCVFHGQIKL